MRTSAVSLLLLFLVVAAAPRAASAQTVRGHLLEAGTGTPISGGSIALLDTAGVIVDAMLTGPSGSFVLQAPRPGNYFVRAERLGYGRMVDGILELGEGGEMNIEFHLPIQPIRLDSLRAEVEALRQDAYLESVGFYEREQRGFGHFITPEELEERPPWDAADLLRWAPWIQVSETLGGTSVQVRRAGTCSPRIFVDGMPASAFDDDIVIEDVVSVDDLIAVEVHAGLASIPLEYAGANTCGVILFWTSWGRMPG